MPMKIKPQSPGNRGTQSASTRPRGNVVAGGLGSKVVRKEGTRDGQKAFGINPGHVAQYGAALGDHVTEQGSSTKYRGEPRATATPISVPLGNSLAKNVGKGGPGAGREVFRCGTQGTQGPVNPGASRPGADKPILGAFGPDSSNACNRR
jgi:hypothetical protein